MFVLPSLPVIAFLAVAAQADQVREFALVRDSKPMATIIVAAEPTVAAAFAAEELQEHLRRITGATLPIMPDNVPVTGSRVLVGRSQATDALGLPGEPLKPQEYIIRYLPDTLVLLGCEAGAARPFSLRRTEGKFGRALEFDGHHDVTVIDKPGLRDEAGTLEAWIWMPADKQPERHGTILRLDGVSPWTYHILQRDMNTSRISYTTYDGKDGHGAASGELAEGWHHVAGTYDAAAQKMELFIDGSSVGTSSYVKTTCASSELGIGGVSPVGRDKVGNAFRGRIDEVRISHGVRSFTQVPAEPYSPDDRTALLLHCDETAGPARDASGTVRSAAPPDPFDQNATLYAVYDFLERACDVRWLAPGEIGLSCPTLRSLVVRGQDVRRAPAMRYRWLAGSALYMPGPPQAVAAYDVRVWQLRMRLGGQPYSVSHSFYRYYPAKIQVEPNVAVQLCLHTRNWWCPSMEANDRKTLRQWREQAPARSICGCTTASRRSTPSPASFNTSRATSPTRLWRR